MRGWYDVRPCLQLKWKRKDIRYPGLPNISLESGCVSSALPTWHNMSMMRSLPHKTSSLTPVKGPSNHRFQTNHPASPKVPAITPYITTLHCICAQSMSPWPVEVMQAFARRSMSGVFWAIIREYERLKSPLRVKVRVHIIC